MHSFKSILPLGAMLALSVSVYAQDFVQRTGSHLTLAGASFAVRYSVERLDSTSKQWTMICDKCATDSDDPWVDPHPGSLGGSYRVTVWNADVVPSVSSQPR